MVVVLTAVHDPIIRPIIGPDQSGTGAIDQALVAI